MRVLNQIGEQGLELDDGRRLLLRPSFRAISSLGTPDEIVAIFQGIHAPPRLMTFEASDPAGLVSLGHGINRMRMRDHWRGVLLMARNVIEACADGDVTPFVGEYGARWESYRPGPVPLDMMVVLARKLMVDGIIGPPPKILPDPEAGQDKAKYTPGFDALVFVSKAIAHLRVGEAEAWDMTMLGFAAAWEAKFGEQKAARHSQEHDDTMSWLAKVNEQRKLKNVD